MVTGHSMGGAMASFCALDLRVIIYNSLLHDTLFLLLLVCMFVELQLSVPCLVICYPYC